jgi:hypothetical protein
VGDALGLGPGEAVRDGLGLGPGEAVGDGFGLGPAGAVADTITVGPVVADAVAVGSTQGSAALLDELRRDLACGTNTTTSPAATTTARTAISAGYALLRPSSWLR